MRAKAKVKVKVKECGFAAVGVDSLWATPRRSEPFFCEFGRDYISWSQSSVDSSLALPVVRCDMSYAPVDPFQ